MNKKIAYVIPNLFTAGSLVCALMALNLIAEGHIVTGCWLVTLSIMLDGLDGKMARLLKATSKIGAEADSLADFVSFGVVPGFLLWTVGLSQLGTIGFLFFIGYVICGGYRLARFNVMAGNPSIKQDFTGLPIPAAAAAIVSFVLFNELILKDKEITLIIPVVISFLSWLMISKIPYKAVLKPFKKRQTTAVLVIALLTLVYWAIFHTIWFYLVGSWAYICYGLYNKISQMLATQQKKDIYLRKGKGNK
ncbi:MAG: CDP-diacylglycerol--serine O-phosphatidyltransferase [Candidatus Cloacimonetes bacterium]|nr:CDP-diacylglycerol--serine O-phosphatidyltransferase [Candidatus Cloacimonadota bacterium]